MTPAPTRFGNYLLDREIARGGMARVYLARLRGLGGFEKKLVVKQVLPELAGDPRFVEMFVAEAKTAVRLSHPHIVPVYELGVVEGVYFLAMEYVEGATLSEILRATGPLSPELLAHVGAELAEALAYAHERFDLVHRDVTPRNAIADAAGHTRLLDFGIAAPASEAQEGIFGTLGYLSPEQLFGEGKVGPRSDLFGLGCTLYHAASGEPPFPRERLEMIEALAAEGPCFSDLPDLPEPLAALLQPTLARDPEERPASARGFGQSLRAWLAKVRPEGMSEALGERVAEARRAKPAGEERAGPSSGEEEQEESRSHTRPIRTPSAEIRTLATSPMLERLLHEPKGEPEPGPEPVTSATAQMADRVLPDEDKKETEEAISDDMSDNLSEENSNRGDLPRISDTVSAKEVPAPSRESGGRAGGLPGPLLLLGAALLGAAVAFFALRAPSSSSTSSSAPSPPPQERAQEQASPEEQVQPEERAQEQVREQARPEEQEQEQTQPEAHLRPSSQTHGAGTRSPNGAQAQDQETSPRVAPAQLTIAATPWAEIFLDGRRVGVSPMRDLRVPAGTHRLRLRCPPLGREIRREIRPEAGAQLRIRADLNAEPPTLEIR